MLSTVLSPPLTLKISFNLTLNSCLIFLPLTLLVTCLFQVIVHRIGVIRLDRALDLVFGLFSFGFSKVFPEGCFIP